MLDALGTGFSMLSVKSGWELLRDIKPKVGGYMLFIMELIWWFMRRVFVVYGNWERCEATPEFDEDDDDDDDEDDEDDDDDVDDDEDEDEETGNEEDDEDEDEETGNEEDDEDEACEACGNLLELK
jgi:hypothetical protein